MEPLSENDPDRIGEYTLIGRLGEGGMGIVYLASAGARHAAVKVIHPLLMRDPQARARFTREIDVLQKISSKHVAKILGHGVDGGTAWFATEFVNGPDLKTRVEHEGPLAPDEWAQLASDLFSALEDIHLAGVTHRDLKPSNVILSDAGARVVDFGVSHVSDATSITSSGFMSGSPAWFSPEQIEGGNVTAASDLFSLGSLLVFAATGRTPWGPIDGMTRAAVFGILASEPDLSGLTSDQQEWVSKLLEKDPKLRALPDRPPEKNASLSAERGPGPSQPPTMNARPVRSPQRKRTGRRPGVAWVLASLLGILASSAAYSVLSARSDDNRQESPEPSDPTTIVAANEILCNGLVPQINRVRDAIERSTSSWNVIEIGIAGEAQLMEEVSRTNQYLAADWSDSPVRQYKSELGRLLDPRNILEPSVGFDSIGGTLREISGELAESCPAVSTTPTALPPGISENYQEPAPTEYKSHSEVCIGISDAYKDLEFGITSAQRIGMSESERAAEFQALEALNDYEQAMESTVGELGGSMTGWITRNQYLASGLRSDFLNIAERSSSRSLRNLESYISLRQQHQYLLYGIESPQDFSCVKE